MTQPLIWLGQFPPGAAAGVPFLEMMVLRDKHKKFIPPCELAWLPGTVEHALPTYSDTDYVQECQKHFNTAFRLIPWQLNIDYVIDMANKHAPKFTWFGTLFDSTLHQCKQILGERCRTVSINYTPSSYDLVKQKWARWHTGIIIKLDKYKQLREKFKSTQQIEQWLLETGSDQFGFNIPNQHHVSADIEIDVSDIWDQSRFAEILNQLGCKFDENDWLWYQHYCKDSG